MWVGRRWRLQTGKGSGSGCKAFGLTHLSGGETPAALFLLAVLSVEEWEMALQRRRAGTKSKDLYVVQAAFRFALSQFLRFSETAARKAGLTPQQHQRHPASHAFHQRDHGRLGAF